MSTATESAVRRYQHFIAGAWAPEPQLPFSGVEDSGWGRFGGTAAHDEFTELRWITVQSGTRPFPF